jgi:Ricin-type beta-trefoil lectin domain-like
MRGFSRGFHGGFGMARPSKYLDVVVTIRNRLVFGVVVLSAILVASPLVAFRGDPNTVTLENVNASGLCIDSRGGQAATVIHLGRCSFQDRNQLVDEIPARYGVNTVEFQGIADGKCLDVPANAIANGVQLQFAPCNGTTAQVWVVENVRGFGQLMGLHSRKCIDVYNWGQSGGAIVDQGACGQPAQTNQLFLIHREYP